jgi:type VI secretion system protein ImpL
VKHWSAGRDVDTERVQLAQKQFDFYAEGLKVANPFSSESDVFAIERARRYLKQFGDIDRVYQFMLAEAGKSSPPVNYHQAFPSAAQAVVDRMIVPGAFTKGGWEFMQSAFKDPTPFFSGEPWVLGEQEALGLDAAALDQLRTRYQNDYIASWRTFIKNAVVLRYDSFTDAANKLKLLSGPQSPLLELFALVSRNTAVGVPTIDSDFKASQAVVPPGSVDLYIGPANTKYMNGLVVLQVSIDQLTQQAGVLRSGVLIQATPAQILQQAVTAKSGVGQMALAFGTDPEAPTVRQLLEAPITNVESLLRIAIPRQTGTEAASDTSADAPPAEVQRPPIGPMLSDNERRRLNEGISSRLQDVDKMLGRIAALHLSEAEKNSVERIRSFHKQSHDALERGEIQAANALAERAVLLAQEVLRGR